MLGSPDAIRETALIPPPRIASGLQLLRVDPAALLEGFDDLDVLDLHRLDRQRVGREDHHVGQFAGLQ